MSPPLLVCRTPRLGHQIDALSGSAVPSSALAAPVHVRQRVDALFVASVARELRVRSSRWGSRSHARKNAEAP